MKLYSYFRSSAAYRVRIALNLKDVEYDLEVVHMLKDGGQQKLPAYLELNPQGLVPTLVDGDITIGQSTAIIEYLEDVFPNKYPLLPGTAEQRARVRQIANAIACDIHPICNLRVLKYITNDMGQSEEAKLAWYRHWVEIGLEAVEAMVAGHQMTGQFIHGDSPGLADCYLVPQMYNARRFNCDLSKIPTLVAIEERCLAMEAFHKASPEQQPEANE